MDTRGDGTLNYLVITYGISGSGKTTVAKQYEKEGFIRVSTDDMRKEMTGSVSDMSKDNEVFNACFYKAYTALKKGNNVIFDSTGLNYVTRKKIQRTGIKAGALVSILVFTDSKNLELCKKRVQEDLSNNVDRSNVPMEVIDKQYKSFIDNLEFLEDEGYDGVLEYDE